MPNDQNVRKDEYIGSELTPDCPTEISVQEELEVQKVSAGTKAEAMFENFLFLGIAVVGLLYSLVAPWGGGSRVMHAGIFPRIVLAIIGLGAIGMFFSNTKYEAPPADRDIPPYFTVPFLLWVGCYVWCALNVGFIVFTAIFLLVTISFVTAEPKKHWKMILLATAIATFLIWGIFVKIVGIALPQTPLF